MEQYTLVQHTGYAYAGNPGFEHAVETRAVTTQQAKRILKLGGAVFDSYEAAERAAESENYQPDNQSIYPHAPGEFTRMLVDSTPVYLPARRLAVQS